MILAKTSLLSITISDTCKNQPKRLDFDDTINLSSLIVILETQRVHSPGSPFMYDHMSGRERHFDAKNVKKSNACRQRETRETDKTVVTVEITVQNQEVGVDCIEGARNGFHAQHFGTCLGR